MPVMEGFDGVGLPEVAGAAGAGQPVYKHGGESPRIMRDIPNSEGLEAVHYSNSKLTKNGPDDCSKNVIKMYALKYKIFKQTYRNFYSSRAHDIESVLLICS
jgi:hypothetical protein